MSERGEEHRTYNWPQYANKLLCDWMAFPAGSLGQFSDVRERSTIHIIDLSMQISCTVIGWLSPSLSSHHVLRFIFGNEPSKCTPGDDEAYIQWSLNSLKMLRPLGEHPPTRELREFDSTYILQRLLQSILPGTRGTLLAITQSNS